MSQSLFDYAAGECGDKLAAKCEDMAAVILDGLSRPIGELGGVSPVTVNDAAAARRLLGAALLVSLVSAGDAMTRTFSGGDDVRVSTGGVRGGVVEDSEDDRGENAP